MNIEDLLQNPNSLFGLGLLGGASSRGRPLLTAYELLQNRRAAESEAAYKKAQIEHFRSQMEQEAARTRAMENQTAVAARKAATQEEIMRVIQRRMGMQNNPLGQQQPGGMPQQQPMGQPGMGGGDLPMFSQLQPPQPEYQFQKSPPSGHPALTPGQPVRNTVSTEDQRVRDSEYIRMIQKEMENPALTTQDRAGLQRELDRLQQAQQQPGFPTPSLIRRPTSQPNNTPEGQARQSQLFSSTPPEPGYSEEFKIGPEGAEIKLGPDYKPVENWINYQKLIQENAREQARQREWRDAPNQAQREEEAKLLAKAYMDTQKDAKIASTRHGRMEQLEFMLDGLNTGKFTPAMTEFRAYAKAAGFEVDPRMPTAQAADKLSKLIAMELKEFSPGQITVWEQQQFQAIQPGLDKDPRTNKILAAAYKKLQKRQMEEAKIWQKHRSNRGAITFEIYDEIDRYREQNPIFNAKEVGLLTGRPALDQFKR